MLENDRTALGRRHDTSSLTAEMTSGSSASQMSQELGNSITIITHMYVLVYVLQIRFAALERAAPGELRFLTVRWTRRSLCFYTLYIYIYVLQI